MCRCRAVGCIQSFLSEEMTKTQANDHLMIDLIEFVIHCLIKLIFYLYFLSCNCT
jgi:hypothetical protein